MRWIIAWSVERNPNCFENNKFFKNICIMVIHDMFEHLRKLRKNRYCAILNKCFRGSLISSKHFLTTLKFLSFYPGLLFVFNEKKASFNSFIDSELFSIILCVWFKKLVNGFEESGIFFGQIWSSICKKVVKLLCYVFISVIFFNSKLFR